MNGQIVTQARAADDYPCTKETIARAIAARDAERAELLRSLIASGDLEMARKLGLFHAEV